MEDLFDLGLSLDDLEGVDIQGETEAEYEVIPAVFTSRDGNIKETIYLTNEVDTALLFNEELDTFSSYDYFTLPEGREVKNIEVLGRFELLLPVMLKETEIKQSILDTFNNRYLRAMLEN